MSGPLPFEWWSFCKNGWKLKLVSSLLQIQRPMKLLSSTQLQEMRRQLSKFRELVCTLTSKIFYLACHTAGRKRKTKPWMPHNASLVPIVGKAWEKVFSKSVKMVSSQGQTILTTTSKCLKNLHLLIQIKAFASSTIDQIR